MSSDTHNHCWVCVFYCVIIRTHDSHNYTDYYSLINIYYYHLLLDQVNINRLFVMDVVQQEVCHLW